MLSVSISRWLYTLNDKELLFFWWKCRSEYIQVFLEQHNKHTTSPMSCVSAAICWKDESRSWPTSVKGELGKIGFKTKGMTLKWSLKGTRQIELCWRGVVGFTTCFFPGCFASTAALAGGEGPGSGEEHGKGRCIKPVKVVKCLAMQSHSRFFLRRDISGHCCKSCGC